MFKAPIQKRLEKYVTQYFAAHAEVKLVVVTGSVGKTSTKRAIATILSEQYRVRMHEGNHNASLSAPLGILGVEYPANIRNPFQWVAVFNACKKRIKDATDVDVIVQELGTDNPGDIPAFGRYLKPDLAIVTAVTPEHMEFFKTLDAVATEELSVSVFSKYTLINSDDIDSRYAMLETNPNFSTYGVSTLAEHRLEPGDFLGENGYRAKVYAPEFPEPFEVDAHVIGEHSLRPIMGAISVAGLLGMTPADIAKGVAACRPVSGRMQLLKGIGDVTIIDDTYNSSPAAASAALRTLYELFANAPQRIAVLGDMRELGAESPAAHEALGDQCDGSLLSWVVTVGPDTEKYLVPAARARGCQVKVCKNALEAGEFVRSISEPGGVVLVKGSQNTIYLEECVKILCEITDHDKLVRQSASWLATKQRYFDKFAA
jgi:UDP-N-acetylmuramoyl-tripeptide--D-alanyl-D-alanine ligase